MRTDSEIKSDAFKLLFSKMDKLEAERFITILKEDSFDYTKWRQSLFQDLPLEEIHRRGIEFSNKLRGGK